MTELITVRQRDGAELQQLNVSIAKPTFAKLKELASANRTSLTRIVEAMADHLLANPDLLKTLGLAYVPAISPEIKKSFLAGWRRALLTHSTRASATEWYLQSLRTAGIHLSGDTLQEWDRSAAALPA